VTSAYDDLDRPPLDATALNRALVRPESGWREVVVVEEAASTNSEVARLAREGAASGLVLVAEHQSSGRGRLDRAWSSPPRSGLTLSVLLDPAGVPTQRWPWLPLLTGVAVVEAVHRVTGVEAALKWPNDVLVDDRKLAGILAERVEAPSTSLAVVGIGLNVTLRREEAPTAEATSLLLEQATTTDRTVVLREVLRVLGSLFSAWAATSGDPDAGLAESYARRCATLGRHVQVALPGGGTLRGEAVRVDASGRLVVRTDGREEVVGAGDVLHVR
jgi:BirA family transcriptional regulator, biotin operon repressor / biotin---[acetyl-CoA-carboxylase] ligase